MLTSRLLFPLKQLVRVGVRNSSIMACQRLNESSAKKLLNDVDNFLFDCDGKTAFVAFFKTCQFDLLMESTM